MHIEPSNKIVQLSSKLKKRFSTITKSTGYIAGWDADDKVFCTCVSGTKDYFTPGLKVVGLFCMLTNKAKEEDELLNICEQSFDKLQLEVENPVVLFVSKEQDDGVVSVIARSYTPYYRTLLSLSIEDIDHSPAILLRASGQLPLVLEVTSDAETLKENVELAIEKLRALFQNQVAAYLLQNTNHILHSLIPPNTEEKCKDLVKLFQDSTESVKSKKNVKKKTPLNFEILMQTTGDSAMENTFNHSVVIHCQRRGFQCASIQLPLDVIIACHETTSVYEIHKLFTTAIEQQLQKMTLCLLKYAKTLNVVTPEPHHFYPDIIDFPVTVIYPLEKSDQDLEKYRADLHKQLLFPEGQPFLKKLNTYDFSATSPSGHLFNPHESINYNGVPGGQIAVVHGKYAYHHYMQDHMNDDGWGCAYRSLQTIISWFKCQGYADVTVPTHKEIQQALVDIGDKQSSFVGSKKWIGSQEVSFCLDHLLQVQSKILFVSSGAEIGSKGRELFNHFRDQGTPIMIGGGVLAHTILGVDFNAETGDLKFLILDPHYTGSEDLNVILSKGWCGWKGVSFWDQSAFYNLCMPQRPLAM